METLCTLLERLQWTSLGGKFTEATFATDLNILALVNMFLGYTPPDIKADIVTPLSNVNAVVTFLLHHPLEWKCIVLMYTSYTHR